MYVYVYAEVEREGYCIFGKLMWLAWVLEDEMEGKEKRREGAE